MANVAGAAAAALLASMYLDAKFNVRSDLRQGTKVVAASLTARYLAQLERDDKLLVYNILEDRASTPQGKDLALIFEDRRWTYTELYHALHPVANWLLKDLGIKKGEVVAVDGANTPEYLLIMLALEAIGAAAALLNCNLTGEGLVHCVKLCESRYLIADKDVTDLVSPVESELKDKGVQTLYYDPSFFETLKDTEALPKERRTGLKQTDTAFILYTSGTTGLPKGVVLRRARPPLLGQGVTGYLGLKPGDCMYTCLPLYHASALGLCMIPCLHVGATIGLGRKFSHSSFWPDIHRSGATHMQYVGELCRYLVNAPPGPLDRGHKLRMAWGNGMRADVWERFRERFGVEIINELYGASDGIAITMNANRGDFSRGAVGVRGPLWRLMNRGERRILIDPVTQEVVRDKNGWAIEAKADEVGETINRSEFLPPINPLTSNGVSKNYRTIY